MAYVLENKKEFERLEKQSKSEAYNYENELSSFTPKETGVILDAGCGSGIVSRYLAKKYTQAQVVGCDFSEQRVLQAKNEAKNISNLQFQVEDLTRLDFEKSSLDAVVCRYVLEHLKDKERSTTLAEFYRCLRPNGNICVVDVDGFLFNLFPQTEFVEKVLSKLATERPFDLHVGRKIPNLLSQAGFVHVSWRIEIHSFQGEKLRNEIEQMRARFELITPFLNKFLESEEAGSRFVKEYFECLRAPEAVLFHNMFIVSAEKAGFIGEVR